MTRQVLIIEGEARSDVGQVHATLERDAAFVCQRLNWDEVIREKLGGYDEQLIVAVAPPTTPKMTDVFEWLRRNPIAVPTIAVLPVDADDAFVRLIAHTADDFIFCPMREVELHQRVQRMLGDAPHDIDAVRRRLMDEFGLTTLVGTDPVFVRAIEEIPRYARTNYCVLITGETGTGKELCARALHHLSDRRQAPFVAVDCGAVPDQLFENELFGHARGAYTDAHRDQRGLIAMADGGTLLLDEIDALSLGSQAKLLRFLQERTYRALGSDRFQNADVRVIASSNRDLECCVREKQFRTDLYFRLNILRLQLPPLRERRSDIELLAQHILSEHGRANPSAAKAFSAAALHVLAWHDWPGNVRELYNVVQRAVVACDGERVLPSHITLRSETPARLPELSVDFRAARAAAVEAFERRYVEDMLRKHAGNVTHAAREARQDRRAFGRFLKKYQINRHEL